ncbi:hypothetical protein JCM4814A_12290 [Streptomyces phaeofaciens JCM 4814]|uniref:Uncharacterized protein n=1 Tax=Streptomyces phaeofaciens TaxID=68254 RepID=A0A918HI95_9ACTN|nr:hypothetical protein GCM10010226_42810 [Streptomyces phaeofaciens]
MPGGGQDDTDGGEHRGPQQPGADSGTHATGALVSEARRARVGGSHGGLIIALARPPPYGRSARFRTPAPDREDHPMIHFWDDWYD